MAEATSVYQVPVAEGVCVYGSVSEYPIYVVEQNYDYFHCMYEADGMLEEGESPCLNAEGKVYYLFFGELPESRPYAVSSMGTFMSVTAAKSWASANLPYFSRWL